MKAVRIKTVSRWFRLDNAAKIFPPTSSKRDPKVFRIACELEKDVNPGSLQQALDRTMEKFPLYRSVLKRGFFWYYLEDSHLVPAVQEETKPPCGPIYDADARTLLFEVTYYRKRINLEIFHALADGTGALQFFRTLLLYYLREEGPYPGSRTEPEAEPDLEDYDASAEQKRADAFSKYYSKDEGKNKDRHTAAHRVRGEVLPYFQIGIIEGRMPLGQTLAKAKAAGASLTEFLGAILILAIGDGMSVRERMRPVVLTIPVDLRRFFPSGSARNFFSVIRAGYDFKTSGGNFEEILAGVKEALRRQLQPREVQKRLNRFFSLEHNAAIRIVPLFIKRPFLRIGNWYAEREETAALSNVGRIIMPPEAEDRIKLFSVFNSTKRPQASLCSYRDTLTVSFSSPFAGTDIQKNFFRSLAAMGIPVEVVSNMTPVTEDPAGKKEGEKAGKDESFQKDGQEVK